MDVKSAILAVGASRRHGGERAKGRGQVHQSRMLSHCQNACGTREVSQGVMMDVKVCGGGQSSSSTDLVAVNLQPRRVQLQRPAAAAWSLARARGADAASSCALRAAGRISKVTINELHCVGKATASKGQRGRWRQVGCGRYVGVAAGCQLPQLVSSICRAWRG